MCTCIRIFISSFIVLVFHLSPPSEERKISTKLPGKFSLRMNNLLNMYFVMLFMALFCIIVYISVSSRVIFSAQHASSIYSLHSNVTGALTFFLKWKEKSFHQMSLYRCCYSLYLWFCVVGIYIIIVILFTFSNLSGIHNWCY